MLPGTNPANQGNLPEVVRNSSRKMRRRWRTGIATTDMPLLKGNKTAHTPRFRDAACPSAIARRSIAEL